MKVTGIVAEYNPFHNGHMHHLKKTMELSGSDAAVCIMSGNFVQRGEAAVIDKWIRAEAALRSGIDLVVELPAAYALSSAEHFAFGAVKILDSMGFVNCISFGSEAGDIERLEYIADVLVNEPSSYRKTLHTALDRGLSFPAAREHALKRYFESKATKLCKHIGGIISSSNNILGIEYLKAIKKLNSSIKPITVRRIGASYNSETVNGEFSSATSIRLALLKEGSNTRTLMLTTPPSSYRLLRSEFYKGRRPVFPHDFEKAIISKLRSMNADQIAAAPDVNEGLENRIKHFAMQTNSLEKLVDGVSTRRYTRTRISRIVFNILLGITSNDLDTFNHFGGPRYIRVLGFTNRGRKLLSMANSISTLPVVVKTANFKDDCNPLFKRMLDIDIHATDQYVLAYKKETLAKGGQDFTRHIAMI